MATLGIDEAVAAVAAGSMTELDAVMAVSPAAVETELHAQFDSGGISVATGIGASPGAAVGQVYFDVDGCLDGADRGELVILAAAETSPADEIAMRMAEGIVTAKGGTASHAAVVARGWGIPAVCGADEISFSDEGMHVVDASGVDHLVVAGDTISIDGTTGEVFLGDLGAGGGGGSESLDTLLGWADAIRDGKVGIRANADSGEDATQARSLGAEGIGLCRTEHMFLGERLPIMRRVILASTDEEQEKALADLHALQEQDFTRLLVAMDGLPVTIRLLDPPLHEFLPDRIELEIAVADGSATDADKAMLGAVREWAEHNPMLGTRGVRLAILLDGLYHMQVKALLAAAANRVAAGGSPHVDIMIPLVSDVGELELMRQHVQAEIDAFTGVLTSDNHSSEITIGTMIETPRAALTAGQIAAQADFFSFGTNDLTQLTWGFSRDDVEARVISRYKELGLLDANPFERLDQAGVGSLVASAITDARRVNPDLEIGVCGEHGGDPSSIAFFVEAGVNYVSCSPFRVPVARLALAQAIGASS